MGAKLREDFIGAWSHASGVVSVGPTLLTIRGQQYYSLATSLTLPALTANTLYFLYASPFGTGFTLAVSTSAPSVYKASTPLSELVGAFYSNGLTSVAWGSFVNIVGTPQTIATIPTNISITGTGGTPVPNGSALISASWGRWGDRFSLGYLLQQTGGGTIGGGTYIWNLPFSMETTNRSLGPYSTYRVGNGKITSNGSNAGNPTAILTVLANSPTQVFMNYLQTSIENTANVGAAAYPMTSSNFAITFSIDNVAISGWANTSLKDL